MLQWCSCATSEDILLLEKKNISALEINTGIYFSFVYSPADGTVQLPLRMAMYTQRGVEMCD